MPEERAKGCGRLLHSFRGQILLAMTGLAVVLVITGAAVSKPLAQTATEHGIGHSLRDLAALEARSLARNLADIRATVTLVAQNRPDLALTSSPHEVQSHLAQELQIMPGVEALYLLSPSGQLRGWAGPQPTPSDLAAFRRGGPALAAHPALARGEGRFDYDYFIAAPIGTSPGRSYLVAGICLPDYLAGTGWGSLQGKEALVLINAADLRIVATAGLQQLPVVMAEPIMARMARSLAPGQVAISEHFSSVIRVPVLAAITKVPGTDFLISVPRSLQSVSTASQHSFRLTAIYGLVGLALAVLLSLLLSFILSRRLWTMGEVSRRLEAGENEVRFPEGGPLEFAQLARQANRALAALNTGRRNQSELKGVFAAFSEAEDRETGEILDQVGWSILTITGADEVIGTLWPSPLSVDGECALYRHPGRREPLKQPCRDDCPLVGGPTNANLPLIRSLSHLSPVCHGVLGMESGEAAIFPLSHGGMDYGQIVILFRPENGQPEDWESVEELIQTTSIVLHNTQTYRQLRQALAQVQEGKEALLKTLAQILDVREHETANHSERVTANAMTLAQYMGYIDPEFLHNLYRGAYLHDLGKIGIPDRVLLKPGPLTAEEWQVMRRHSVIGAELLGEVAFLERAREIVLYHHEHWDGSGYPKGLWGANIPLGARIFAVVDALDAMTSDRPYRPAMGYAEARSRIEWEAGHQFDPEVVAAFLNVAMGEWLLATGGSGAGEISSLA